MEAEYSHLAVGHKVWVGSLTPELCDASALGPMLEWPQGVLDAGAPRLALRDVQLSVRRRCAVATYANRADALAALEALQQPYMYEPPGGGARVPRQFAVGWALRHATLRVSGLSPEVGEELLRQTFSQHGKLLEGGDGVELLTDEDGEPTGTALVRYERRGAASRMAAAAAANLLMIGGCVAPAKVDFPPGALDTAGLGGLVDDALAPAYGGGRGMMEGAWLVCSGGGVWLWPGGAGGGGCCALARGGSGRSAAHRRRDGGGGTGHSEITTPSSPPSFPLPPSLSLLAQRCCGRSSGPATAPRPPPLRRPRAAVTGTAASQTTTRATAATTPCAAPAATPRA